MTRSAPLSWLLPLVLASAPLGGCFGVSGECELFYDCGAAGPGGSGGLAGSGGSTAQAGSGGEGGSIASCGDGHVDPGEECDDGNTLDDDECASCATRGASCAAPVEVALAWSAGMALPPYSVTGSTVKGGNHETALCASAGPDRVFQVTIGVDPPQTPVLLTASLARAGTTFQSVLVATEGRCGGSENGLCADLRAPPGQGAYHGGEVLSFPVKDGDTWYVFVDGEGPEDAGDYHLTLDLSTGDSCDDPVPVVLEPSAAASPIAVTGSTAPPHTNASNASPSCSSWGKAEDVVYAMTASAAGLHTFSLEPTTSVFDATMFLQSECGNVGSELACVESAGDAGKEVISQTLGAGETVYLWIDGKYADDKGAYTLVVTPPAQ